MNQNPGAESIESNDNSLVSIKIDDLAGSGKGIVKLIASLESALGGVFRPTQIRRIAHAEYDAKIIDAKGERDAAIIMAQGKHALDRLRAREDRNLAAITQLAADELEHISDDSISPLPIDDDWLHSALHEASKVSNTQMQSLWAKILSGEIAKPGSFSKRLLMTLAGMSAADAQTFAVVVNHSLILSNDGLTPFIFDDNTGTTYCNETLTWQQLTDLESTGLIRFHDEPILVQYMENHEDDAAMMLVEDLNAKILLRLRKTLPIGSCIEIKCGCVALTSIGHELSKIVQRNPSEIVYEILVSKNKHSSTLETITYRLS